MAALFFAYVEGRGADAGELLTASGLTREALSDVDGRIPLTSLYVLIEAAREALEDPCLGLHFATSLELADLDALGFLMITSATFGAALERMFRYQRMWAEGERYEQWVEGERVRVTYEQYGPARPAHVQMVQMAFCDFVVNGRRFIPELEFDSVHFRHPEPAEAGEYQATFGVPIEFGAAVDEVRFPSRLLDLALPDANEALCAFFDRYTRDKLDRLPGEQSVVARVRSLLRKLLPEGQVKVEHLAARMHMSTRTLQRRLGEEGTSLHAELDEVRRQQALYFLQAGVAISELSWLLGYSEPSAFHRAFKRWTNTSPEAWRSTHRASPG
ncbi:MAG: AraC family transcriptional regulator [Polyangiaceae bacterium]